MRVLITGSAGFAGSHLVEHCLAENDDVWGTCYNQGTTANLTDLLDHITLRVGDVTDPKFMNDLLSEVQFDVVYGLAAISFVPVAERSPSRVFAVNLVGGINLLEAVRTQSPKTRVVLISSAEIYGHVRPEHLPIKETQPFAPANIVGSTKAAMELAIHPYIETYDLDVVIARPFNHTGPRQVPNFVCSTFAEQIALIELGAEPIIRVGNLTPKRDFADARDIVRGYRCLAFSGQHGQAYNLASGKSFAIREILDMLVSMARVKVEVLQDPDRMRQVQVMDVRGDISKIKSACGWEPRISLEKSLRDLLNWHRNEQRSKKSPVREGAAHASSA